MCVVESLGLSKVSGVQECKVSLGAASGQIARMSVFKEFSIKITFFSLLSVYFE